MKGIQTTKLYCRGRPSPWQAKIMGEKSATSPEAIHSRIAKRDSKPYGLAIGEWWRDNPRRSSHLRIKYPQLTPWPHWCGCDPWTGRWGSQQLTERQKEWPMGHALEDRHGWLTSVGGGWTEERNIWQQRSPKGEGGGGQEEKGGQAKGRRLLCDREGLGIPVLERGVPSPSDVGPPNSVCFSPPKQAVALSEPNFWTHSLQIHCNGLGPKTVTLQTLFT